MKSVLLLSALVASVCGKVYFEEKFADETYEKRWIQSEASGKEWGKFVNTPGAFYNCEKEDKGIKTSEDARFYGLSTKFEKFTNEDKPLVIQFSVKHEQSIDCGGGYLKVFNCDLDPKNLHGETPYEIMFGPDICGPSQKKVHVIFSYKGKNLLIKKDIRCKDDVFTHFYTLIVKPDNTYEVLIDNSKVESGSLEEDWDFLEPKMINDPKASKPSDWVDEAEIDDPEDKKPEDWDQPEHIEDKEAVRPEDWDEEMDGEWEPPLVNNPEYKGTWKPKKIANPAYKGEWKHPQIENPDYQADDKLYRREEICAVGLDLWQVKSGTIFDNFLITDDPEIASESAATVKATQDGEKKMKDAQDEENRKKMEEENKDSAKDDDKDEDEDESDEDEKESTDSTKDEL